jgi:hypothetical protein
MFIISIIALIGLLITGAIMFVDCKIIDDLPESNSFKKWWRRHIVAPDLED